MFGLEQVGKWLVTHLDAEHQDQTAPVPAEALPVVRSHVLASTLTLATS